MYLRPINPLCPLKGNPILTVRITTLLYFFLFPIHSSLNSWQHSLVDFYASYFTGFFCIPFPPLWLIFWKAWGIWPAEFLTVWILPTARTWCHLACPSVLCIFCKLASGCRGWIDSGLISLASLWVAMCFFTIRHRLSSCVSFCGAVAVGAHCIGPFIHWGLQNWDILILSFLLYSYA